MVVGWYHSHPGFGCWLSGVDINTQQARLSGMSKKSHLGFSSRARAVVTLVLMPPS